MEGTSYFITSILVPFHMKAFLSAVFLIITSSSRTLHEIFVQYQVNPIEITIINIHIFVLECVIIVFPDVITLCQ